MYFYNLTFILGFFPVTMLVYYLTGLLFRRWGKSVAAENVVLFLASLYFFSFQENAYLPLLLLMIAVDYGAGWLIFSIKKHPSLRSGVFRVAIFLNILALVLFGGSALADYFAGLIGGKLQIARTPGMLYTETSGILFGGVFGVLFYTLHGISYLSDIYRKKAEPEKNPVNTAVYISMFPLMVVGPAQIYHKVQGQFRQRNVRRKEVGYGLLRMMRGAAKLLLFGLPFRGLFQTILSMDLENLPVFSALFLWFVHFLTIYFLFTGCSDMANGMCLMLGFHFEENYDMPCVALSVTEYWKRWNVSLTAWFREYVYIPLGGNHCDRNVQAWNLFLTWVCVGFWHGFSVNTLAFGIFFGALTVLEFYLDSGGRSLFDLHDLRAKTHRDRKAVTAVRRDIRFQRWNAETGQFTFRPENFRTSAEPAGQPFGKNKRKNIKAEKRAAMPKTPRRIYVIFSVAIAWMLLMFETPEEMISFLRALFGANGAGLGDSATIYYIYSNLFLIFAALACMSPVPRKLLELVIGERNRQMAAIVTGAAVIAVCVVGLFVSPEILEENAETNRFYCKITTYISYLTNQNEEKDIYFGDDGYLFASYKSWLVDESVQEENLEAIAGTIEKIKEIRLTDGEESETETDGTETAATEDGATEETENVVTEDGTVGETETVVTDEVGAEEETETAAAEDETTDETESAVTDDESEEETETSTTVDGTSEAESVYEAESSGSKKISVSCVLVPSASYILSDEVPLYAPEWDEGLTHQAAREILGSNYTSCISALKRRTDEELYYHSEKGVTSIGAYYVYTVWAREIGLEPAPYSDRSMKTVYDSFYGSLARTLRFYPEADNILRYRSFRYTPVTVEYSDGVVTYSIYEDKYLGTKQEMSYYLNGTQDIVRVTTNRTEAEDLLVVTDDSGRRYVQYFVEHFHTITIVNVNEYEGSVTELAEETGADEVLFLFDMSSVYGSDSIAKKLNPQ